MGPERRGGRGRRGPRGGGGSRTPGVGVLFRENKVVLVFYPGVHPCVAGAGRVREKLGEEGHVGCVIVGHAMHGEVGHRRRRGWGGESAGERRLCSLDRLALSILLRYILPLTFLNITQNVAAKIYRQIQIPPLAFSGFPECCRGTFLTDISTPPI